MPITNGANTATLRWPRFLWTPASSNTTSITHHPWKKAGPPGPGTPRHSARSRNGYTISWGRYPRRLVVFPVHRGLHRSVESLQGAGDRGRPTLCNRRHALDAAEQVLRGDGQKLAAFLN